MLEAVGALLREVAAEVVMPVFGRLAEGDVEEKSPGDLVTVADRAAEAVLTARLVDLLPGSAVVGEEAVAADPSVVEALEGDGDVWVVDPVDGTRHFAAGRGPFAVMVALRRRHETVGAWVLHPLDDVLWQAERGGGTWVDGTRVRAPQHLAAPVRASTSPRWFPEDAQARFAASDVVAVPSRACAGAEYPDVITGERDAAAFWRTYPWDHLPGVLLAEEAGGVARRPEGDAYDPAEHDRRGLVVARSPAAWAEVADLLVGPRGARR